MLDNLLELIDSLSNYFDLNNAEENEWPFITIWSQGSFYTGPIPDELYEILVGLKVARDDFDYNSVEFDPDFKLDEEEE